MPPTGRQRATESAIAAPEAAGRDGEARESGGGELLRASRGGTAAQVHRHGSWRAWEYM